MIEYSEEELNKMLGSLIVISNYDVTIKTILNTYLGELIELYKREKEKKGI